jgi:hypothetical protein
MTALWLCAALASASFSQQSGAPPAAPAVSGAPVETTLPVDEVDAKLITPAEQIRIKLLSKALAKAQDLIQIYQGGDTGVVENPKTGKPMKVSAATEDQKLVLMRAAFDHLNLKPNKETGYDEARDAEKLKNLKTAARLLSENLGKPWLPKRKATAADPGGAVARNDGDKVVLFPEFWTSGKEPYPSPLCPGIILMHEYFHHLIVNPGAAPGKTQAVYHGEIQNSKQTFPSYSMDYALANAYSLTSFTVELALGRPLECVPNWKPGR